MLMAGCLLLWITFFPHARNHIMQRHVCYKKVLLRDRKRHTAHCIASTHSAVLSLWGEGVPLSWTGGMPVLPGGTPVLMGVPKSWLRGTTVLPGRDTPVLRYPQSGWGTPHQVVELGYPPGKDLGPETWERTWGWGTPRKGPGKRKGAKDLGKNLVLR